MTTAYHQAPTREDFLSYGWSPAHGTTPCPICYDDTAMWRVQLLCHESHIFCEDCIITWLSQPTVNTCPMCRTILFSLEDDDDQEEPLLSFRDLMHRIRGRRDSAAFDFLRDHVERESDALMLPTRIVDERRSREWHHFVGMDEEVAMETAWLIAEEEVEETWRRYSDGGYLFGHGGPRGSWE